MDSIHAKCLAVTTKAGRTLICGKSKGHDKSTTPARREHFDPGADERWGETPAPDAAAERDCLALAVQFALSWDGAGTVHELREGIRQIIATMPASEPETPRCTCARSWNLHSQTCDLYVPGHDMANPDACQAHGFQADDPRRGRLGLCVACRHPAGADCHPHVGRER